MEEKTGVSGAEGASKKQQGRGGRCVKDWKERRGWTSVDGKSEPGRAPVTTGAQRNQSPIAARTDGTSRNMQLAHTIQLVSRLRLACDCSAEYLDSPANVFILISSHSALNLFDRQFLGGAEVRA